MIHDIREAFNELLEENDWMDTETRKVAEDKANSMTERIGYPEYITNDTRLEEEYKNVIQSDGHFEVLCRHPTLQHAEAPCSALQRPAAPYHVQLG